jgi:hypothetical protein
MVPFTTKWGSVGTDDGQLNFPQGLTIKSSTSTTFLEERVFVADTFNNRIQEFAPKIISHQ